MSHEWKFGDWGREKSTGLIVRFIGLGDSTAAVVFRDASLGKRDVEGLEYLPNCTGFDWKPIEPPEPKYRPFATAAEFRGHRDRWWKNKGKKMLFPPANYNDHSYAGWSWEELFENCEFEDGTPFGVLENE
jgi:hypothetical protein